MFNSVTVIKNYKFKFIIVMLMIILFLFLGNFLFYKYVYDNNTYFIPNHLIYYQGNNKQNIVDYCKENNIVFYETYPLKGNFLDYEYSNIEKTNIILPLSKLIIEEASQETVSWIQTQLNDNIINYNLGISIGLVNPIINKTNLPNESLGITEILEGNYPQSNKEVLIPEIYAIGLLNKYNISTYKELIGKEVELKINYNIGSYTISGIYSGENHDIIFVPNDSSIENYELSPKMSALFIEVDEESKQKILNTYSEEVFLTSADFRKIYLINKLIYFYDFIIILLCYMFLKSNLLNSLSILNHFRFSFKNIVTVFWIPTLLIIVFIIICEIMLK